MLNARLLRFYIVLAVLSPNIAGVAGGILRLDDAVLAVLVLSIAVRGAAGSISAPRGLLVALAALVVVTLASAAVATLSSGGDLPDRTAREVVRGFKYAAVLIAFSNVAGQHLRPIVSTLFGVTLIAVAVQVAQTVGLPWRVEAETFYYFGTGTSRAASSFGNPNVFAAYLVGVGLLAFAWLLTKQDRSKLAQLTLLAVALGVTLTASRSAIAVGAIVAVLMVGFVPKPRPAALRLMLAGALLFAVVMPFAIESDRLPALFQVGSTDQSFDGKILRTQDALRHSLGGSLGNVVIGVGPISQAGREPTPDTEFGWLVLWYGAAGIAAFWAIVAAAWLLVLRARNGDPAIRLAGLGIVIAMVLFGLVETTLINNRVFPIYLVVFGLAYASQRAAVVTQRAPGLVAEGSRRLRG